MSRRFKARRGDWRELAGNFLVVQWWKGLWTDIRCPAFSCLSGTLLAALVPNSNKLLGGSNEIMYTKTLYEILHDFKDLSLLLSQSLIYSNLLVLCYSSFSISLHLCIHTRPSYLSDRVLKCAVLEDLLLDSLKGQCFCFLAGWPLAHYLPSVCLSFLRYDGNSEDDDVSPKFIELWWSLWTMFKYI